MFRHCWVIFREKLSVVVTLGCTIQLSENVHSIGERSNLSTYSKYCRNLQVQIHFEYSKNTNHQKMHKESFIININILLRVSTLLGHLQEELPAVRAWPGPRRVHASKNNAVHSQQHILAQLYSAT
jgi:hypothetical protein